VLSTLIKQALLRRLYKLVVNPATLLSVLEAFLVSRVDESSAGKSLIATQGNGHSVQFSIPAHMSPVDVIEFIADALNLYEKAKAYLGGAPTDAQIYAEMLALLQPADEVYSDFSSLRTEVAA
jgi:hypothetical protein